MQTANATPVAPPPKRVPVRTCVACRTAGGKRGLLRVVRLPDDAGVEVDVTGKQSGRGAYVCATQECVQIAQKRKSLERSLKVSVSDEVFAALRVAVESETPLSKGATTMS